MCIFAHKQFEQWTTAGLLTTSSERTEMSIPTPCFSSCIKPLLIIALCTLLPHTAYAGAWTLQKGHFWGKITTLERYNAEGNTGGFGPAAAAAVYNSRSVYLDFFYGINDRVDIGLQIPFISNKYDHDNFNFPGFIALDASGIGDVRGFAKINLVRQSVVATLKLGFKAPTGSYDDGQDPAGAYKNEGMSVGSGQSNIDVILQLGQSFYPAPVYANLDLGYRFRMENSTSGFNPGEEIIFNAEIGVNPTNILLLALKLEGIYGSEGSRGNDDISITYLAPTALINVHQNLSLEASVRVPVAGRNFFGGRLWGLGLYFQK